MRISIAYLRRTPETAGKMQNAVGYYAAIFAMGLVCAVLGPTLPALAEQTGANLQTVSLLFPARSFGYMLGVLQSGRWYDRLTGHAVLVTGVLVMAGTMAFVPLLAWPLALALAMLILGITEGIIDVGSNTLLVWTCRERLGSWMNGLHFCFGLGSLLAPLIVAQAIAVGGEASWAYWVVAILTMPGGLWLLRLRSPSPPLRDQAAPAEKARVGLMFSLAVFAGLYVGAEVGFGGWIYSYAVAKDVSHTTGAAYLTAAFWGFLTAGRLLAIPLAARVNPTAIILGSLTGCLVSAGAMLIRPDNAATIWLGTCGLGLSMASIFPSLLVFAERRLVVTGRVTSSLLVGGSVGAMSLPWLIGQFFESVGPVVLLVAILASVIAGFSVFLVVMRTPERGDAGG